MQSQYLASQLFKSKYPIIDLNRGWKTYHCGRLPRARYFIKQTEFRSDAFHGRMITDSPWKVNLG